MCVCVCACVWCWCVYVCACVVVAVVCVYVCSWWWWCVWWWWWWCVCVRVCGVGGVCACVCGVGSVWCACVCTWDKYTVRESHTSGKTPRDSHVSLLLLSNNGSLGRPTKRPRKQSNARPRLCIHSIKLNFAYLKPGRRRDCQAICSLVTWCVRVVWEVTCVDLSGTPALATPFAQNNV